MLLKKLSWLGFSIAVSLSFFKNQIGLNKSDRLNDCNWKLKETNCKIWSLINIYRDLIICQQVFLNLLFHELVS